MPKKKKIRFDKWDWIMLFLIVITGGITLGLSTFDLEYILNPKLLDAVIILSKMIFQGLIFAIMLHIVLMNVRKN